MVRVHVHCLDHTPAIRSSSFQLIQDPRLHVHNTAVDGIISTCFDACLLSLCGNNYQTTNWRRSFDGLNGLYNKIMID